MKKQLFLLFFTGIVINSHFIRPSDSSAQNPLQDWLIAHINNVEDSELYDAFESFKNSKLFKELGFERFEWKEVKRNHTGGCFKDSSYCSRFPGHEKNPEKEEWYLMTAWKATSLKKENQITTSGQN
ncbi:MAG: hypothetical protein NTU89_00525 [Candidatus Dependentiae bacterium]|nr:hypothetical protein [Candidatus Dependentiae bacterium]